MAKIKITLSDDGKNNVNTTIKSNPPFKVGELSPAQVVALTLGSLMRAIGEKKPFHMNENGEILELDSLAVEEKPNAG